ncbi:MAG: hypothetical protein R3212_06855, partial [Xanthomonadales bacterium]|nr:hypothetical protein [Xanthomonadales bacterium]
RDLDRLVEAEMIQKTVSGTEPMYRFKHALVQDAAYGTLLYATRRAHHARIADAILDVFPEVAKEKPEILAHHLSKAGRPLEAVDYWQAAGLNATNRSANAEAVHHLSSGIETLRALPSRTNLDLQKELELQVALGPPLVAARGYASSELEEAYTRALKIGEQLETGISDFRVLWGLSSFFLLRGQLAQSLDLQRKCVELAERDGNEDWRVLASSWLGTVLFYRNQLEEAAGHLEWAVQRYRTESATQLGYQFGLDPAVLARVHLVWLHWLRGETDQAHGVDEETLSFAEGLDHPLSHVHALNFSVVLQLFQGHFEEALKRADQVLTVSGEFEFPHYLAYAQITRGYATAKLGSVEKGIDEMVKGLRARRETGAELVRPMFLTMLAEVLWASGQPDWAIDALDEAEGIVAENGEDWLEPETLRVRGLVLEQNTPGDKAATDCLSRAVAMARASGAVSLEIRALLSLVELQAQGAGDAKDARSHIQRLAELLQKLPPGIDSTDRQRSHELLEVHGVG